MTATRCRSSWPRPCVVPLFSLLTGLLAVVWLLISYPENMLSVLISELSEIVRELGGSRSDRQEVDVPAFQGWFA